MITNSKAFGYRDREAEEGWLHSFVVSSDVFEFRISALFFDLEVVDDVVCSFPDPLSPFSDLEFP